MPIDIEHLRREIRARGFDWRVREVPDTEAHGLGFKPADPAKDRLALSLGERLLGAIRERAAHPEADEDEAAPLSLLLRNVHISAADLIARIDLTLNWFDWRDQPGVIGPVRDQGRCGSCVSFATTGLVAAQAAIELGIANLHLSEADQHFCSSHGPTCAGWNIPDALDQIRERGVIPHAAFPYMSAFDSPPQPDPADPDLWQAHCSPPAPRRFRTYSITNFTAYKGTDRQAYLRTVGPLVGAYTVYEDFDHYDGGVYRHVWGEERGGHAVLVVGYSAMERAWICRNSWSETFGGAALADGTGGGFFKIGYGECGIDDSPFYGCTGVTVPLSFDIRNLFERERRPLPPDSGPPDLGPHDG